MKLKIILMMNVGNSKLIGKKVEINFKCEKIGKLDGGKCKSKRKI